MLNKSTLILMLSIFAGCSFALAQDAHPTSDSASRRWLILPGGAKGGDISDETSEADLIETYGRANVVDKDLDNGNGEMEKNTIIFPHDPRRRLFILWKDQTKKTRPTSISIVGKKSVWRTVHGISLGTSLKQLESMNKKSFYLDGFAWDYSGTVISWDGALGQELGEVESLGRVLLRLDAPQSQFQSPEYQSLLGEKAFSSALPAMQTLNPTIYAIVWYLR
jgi:hypothetical protein